MVRVGVAGLGNSGQVLHVGPLSSIEGFKLQAVCDVDAALASRTAQRHGSEACDSFESLICRDDVDLVVLATPNHLHAPQAVQALRAGKHVVVDKPMALSAAEAQGMIVAARKAGRMLSVYHNRRWDPDYLMVSRIIREGVLGTVFSVESRMGGFGATRGWRCRKACGGGVLNDIGPHLIDQMLRLIPSPPVSVYGQVQSRIWENEVDNQFRLWMRHVDGTDSFIEETNCTRLPAPRWLIYGTEGSLVADGTVYPRMTVKKSLGGMEVTIVPEPEKESWHCYYENIRDVLGGTAELIVKPEQSMAALAVMDALRESSASGRVIDLPAADA